jgi:hypothetical protein
MALVIAFWSEAPINDALGLVIDTSLFYYLFWPSSFKNINETDIPEDSLLKPSVWTSDEMLFAP